MSVPFLIVTLFFIVISAVMILIILVQRPQGGGLVGAFGGAGAGGTETVFGGRVGDALTWATVGAFVLYLGVAITLNKIESRDIAVAADTQEVATEPVQSPRPTVDVEGPRPGAIELREPLPGEQLPPELLEQIPLQQPPNQD
jgi:preprotein translocase subunit SecG